MPGDASNLGRVTDFAGGQNRSVKRTQLLSTIAALAVATAPAVASAQDVLPITVEGGVVFGDGIEDDRLAFTWGRVATIRRAATPLRLVA